MVRSSSPCYSLALPLTNVCVFCVIGEYKMILRLMSVLTHGKEAKRIADKAIDVMSGVQNLRQAIYE